MTIIIYIFAFLRTKKCLHSEGEKGACEKCQKNCFFLLKNRTRCYIIYMYKYIVCTLACEEDLLEQIYTIPVNEAFDAALVSDTPVCPFCSLFKKLEEDELDIILGASMMEPDIRQKTNDQGFCLDHFKKMLIRRRRLGMGLILESHLAEVKKKLSPTARDLVGGVGTSALAELLTLEEDCYVCSRIEKNLSAMTATAVYLYQSDPKFTEKFKGQKMFCLVHFRAMADYAKKKLQKKLFREFYECAFGILDNYLTTLTADVSWFCKKFDYRYDEEPWYNSKDAIERAIFFLSGDDGTVEQKKGTNE